MTNSQPVLYYAVPEELVLRTKAGDSDAAFLMGLMCLSGIGVEQNLTNASSYFIKAKQLGAKNTEVFLAYINECHDKMIAAIDTYVGKESSAKDSRNITDKIEDRFKRVKSERKRLATVLNEYGLPDCPFDTALNDLMNELDSKKRSLSDVCSIVSLSDDNEAWCRDTAQLLFEEGQDGLAGMWLNKTHPDPDDELLDTLKKAFEKRLSENVVIVDLEGDSLLKEYAHIRILPESTFSSKDRIRKALAEWSIASQNRKEKHLEEQRRLEEERQRKIEEERRKAEEERKRKEEEAKRKVEEERRKAEEERKRKEAEAKRKAEEEKRRAEEEARKRAEERTFIVGRYGRQRDEILDKTVSRQHCRVSLLDDGMVEIENLSKSNGTVINGET